jgi:hypothetical protein
MVNRLQTNLIDHRSSWIQNIVGLLDVATQQLEKSEEAAQSAIDQAISLLQEQMRTRSRRDSRARREPNIERPRNFLSTVSGFPR